MNKTKKTVFDKFVSFVKIIKIIFPILWDK